VQGGVSKKRREEKRGQERLERVRELDRAAKRQSCHKGKKRGHGNTCVGLTKKGPTAGDEKTPRRGKQKKTVGQAANHCTREKKKKHLGTERKLINFEERIRTSEPVNRQPTEKSFDNIRE